MLATDSLVDLGRGALASAEAELATLARRAKALADQISPSDLMSRTVADAAAQCAHELEQAGWVLSCAR